MYNHLSGTLISADPVAVVLECSGVGYCLRVPLPTLEHLPQPGEPCTLLTHLHVREDAMDLYGFAQETGRMMFRKLIAVSGVGPAAAMSLMSRNTIADICAAVRRNDPAPLQKAKGVGRKTAERVVLELRGAIEQIEVMLKGESPGTAELTDTTRDVKGTTSLALINLGYSESEAERAAQEAIDALGSTSLSELLREALKRIR